MNLEARAVRRRAVITGMGAVSAAGEGVEALGAALRDGGSRIGPVTLFDASAYPSGRAAQVPGRPGDGTDGRGRSWRFLLRAAAEALESAGLGRAGFGGARSAVVLGTTLGGMDILAGLLEKASDPRAAFVLPYHAGADALADRLGAGDATTIAGACASSLMALGEAARMVESGERDAVLAGGFDALSEFVHAGFSSLLALDPVTLRPFDARRRGLVIGEGAGMLLVEDRDAARSAGRTPLATIASYATRSDANHITGPHPDGDGLFGALEEAWERGGLAGLPDAVHAHGTGTLYNDRMEGIALRRFLGAAADAVPVTASKGVIGHALGASGALETIACVLMLRDGFVPPAANFEVPDPEVGIAPQTVLERRPLGSVLKCAAGFGGQNAALVLVRSA